MYIRLNLKRVNTVVYKAINIIMLYHINLTMTFIRSYTVNLVFVIITYTIHIAWQKKTLPVRFTQKVSPKQYTAKKLFTLKNHI